VRIDICCRGDITVAQPALDVLNVPAYTVKQCRYAVPIGYNKDKSEIPVFSRVCRFVLILFPLKNPPKMGVIGSPALPVTELAGSHDQPEKQ